MHTSTCLFMFLYAKKSNFSLHRDTGVSLDRTIPKGVKGFEYHY